MSLLACEHAGDLERAEQWCRIIQEFSRQHGCEPLFPFCHVTYGGILAATGHWAQAEQELALALDAFSAGHRAMRVLALARLADLRLRQDRVEDARQLLSGYEEHPLTLRATVRLWLLDGQAALAAATLQRRLEQVGAGSLLAAPLLSLLVDAQLPFETARTRLELAHALAQTHSELALGGRHGRGATSSTSLRHQRLPIAAPGLGSERPELLDVEKIMV